MPPENVEKVRQYFIEEDHAEAFVINQEFDRLVADGVSGDVTTLAIEKSNAIHADRVFGAENFGYEVVKNAQRWLRYRAAHLKDRDELLNHIQDDLDDNYILIPSFEKAGSDQDNEHRWEEQSWAERLVGERHPLVVHFLAHMNIERTAIEKTGATLLTPLDFEKTVAFNTLLNVLDELAESDSATTIGEDSVFTGAVEMEVEMVEMTEDGESTNATSKLSSYAVNIMRHADQSKRHYRIELYDLEMSELGLAIEAESPGAKLPSVNCEILELPEDIFVTTATAEHVIQPLGSLAALAIANDLSQSDIFSFTRPPFPKPQQPQN